MTSLFAPIPIGDIALANHIVAAPLVPIRALAGNCPGALAVEYSGQCAATGLINDYRHATHIAVAAGFDGVEVHGADTLSAGGAEGYTDSQGS